MKKEIHPTYIPAQVTCACGNSFVTRATVPAIKVETCGACHPFYTGRQRIIDTEGRVERFRQRYEKFETSKKAAAKEKPAAAQ
jgi:large subunit ribosomal protein L31